MVDTILFLYYKKCSSQNIRWKTKGSISIICGGGYFSTTCTPLSNTIITPGYLFKFTLNHNVLFTQHNKSVFFRLLLQRNFKKNQNFSKK